MKESISIAHLRTISAADLAGFEDVLVDAIDPVYGIVGDRLSDSSSRPDIQSNIVHPRALDGNAIRVTWLGSFEFSTPDKAHRYTSPHLSVTVASDELNHQLLLKLLHGRSRQLADAYRSILTFIGTIAELIKNGDIEPPTGMSGAEYLHTTLETALAACPDHN